MIALRTVYGVAPRARVVRRADAFRGVRAA
jgi:hypothetical protein